MKLFVFTGLVLLITLCFFSYGFAEDIPNTNMTSEHSWEGTWSDANYTLTIMQNGNEISGIALSNNIDLYDPFQLSGNISDDGKTFQGMIQDSGTIVMKISEDKMSYTGNGTVDILDNASEPYTYTSQSARNGTSFNPDAVWSGEWSTSNTTSMLTQNGNSVTGTYRPLSMNEYLGIIEGTVSDDGTTLSSTWIYRENISFILAEDGLSLYESDCEEKDMAFEDYCMNLTKQV